MNVLVVKTSSMGDVIHTLPALTDASRMVPGIRFDWVVEENLAEIPAWHPAVDRTIAVALRRWRRQIWRAIRSGEWRRFRDRIAERRYDAVIDAQGLLKSAVFVTRLARGPHFGLDRNSAREPLAALFYDRPIAVAREQHAVERTRQLFAGVLGYQVPDGKGEYGIAARFGSTGGNGSIVFVHGTTRHEKHWPDAYWSELADLATAAGRRIRLPWGNEAERERALRIAHGRPSVEVLPRLGLEALAGHLAAAAAIVSVDTGLSHLAAALDRPNVVLFGPTDPGLVGGYGKGQVCLRAGDFPPVERKTDPAIFAPLTPEIVWKNLKAALDGEARQWNGHAPD